MEVFFSEIPAEGLPISGELDPAYFDLSEHDSIRVVEPISFELTLYAFSEAVVLSGKIEGQVELQCVTCLEFFPFMASFPKWQSEVEIEKGEVSFDPRESLRDEILLALPNTPRCDELADRDCPKAGILAAMEEEEWEVESGSRTEESKEENIWDALDQLDH